jgi:hypothetical protein
MGAGSCALGLRFLHEAAAFFEHFGGLVRQLTASLVQFTAALQRIVAMSAYVMSGLSCADTDLPACVRSGSGSDDQTDGSSKAQPGEEPENVRAVVLAH